MCVCVCVCVYACVCVYIYIYMRGACYHTPRAPAITRLEWAGVGSRGGGGQVRASAATDARG